MKYISTIFSVLALLLIIVLFFLFFNHTKQIERISVATEKQSASTFRIAYFELDSLEAHYEYFKDGENQLKTKESVMNSELSSMQSKFQKKVAEWQQKGSSMTQAENQQAQQEYASMEQNFQARKQSLTDELAKAQGEIMTDIKRKIEIFLKDYNGQRNYAFIFAYDQSSFIYYRDSAYNITNDLINGLNAQYKKKN
ncbi:MAG TPA: OmpH family outer membrane protein [Puia sp.]|nr:OmpH family outer membrane protein [Puia sp.]